MTDESLTCESRDSFKWGREGFKERIVQHETDRTNQKEQPQMKKIWNSFTLSLMMMMMKLSVGLKWKQE
jgi:hypothetical protein